MKTRFIALAILGSLASATAGVAAPAGVAATARPGPYMAAFVGASVPRDATVTTDDFFADTTFTDRVEFDPGINAGIVGGYDFGYLRLDGELSYKHGSMAEIIDKSDNYHFRNVDGDVASLSLMFNGYLDLHNNSPITPYLSGGIGFATIYLSDTFGTDTRGSSADEVQLYEEDYDTVFAWQAGGGVEIALNRMLSLDLGYRYFRTAKARFDSSWDQSSRLRFESHNASAGLRFKF